MHHDIDSIISSPACNPRYLTLTYVFDGGICLNLLNDKANLGWIQVMLSSHLYFGHEVGNLDMGGDFTMDHLRFPSTTYE